MRISGRVHCGRFPVESAALTPVAGPADVAHKATATDAAPGIVFVICIFAVAARLIFINQAYVDHWSLRQSDVAAIARNFLQNGFRFGYPQIDWAGNAPGYVGTEFPILPFIAAQRSARRKALRGRPALQKHFVRNLSSIRYNSCNSWVTMNSVCTRS